MSLSFLPAVRRFPAFLPAAKLAAAALAATMIAAPVWANPTSGMIDGNYFARMSASTYMRDSSGYTDVCIQIVGSGSTANGTIKGRRHNGTWETLLDSQVTLDLTSAASSENCLFYFVRGQGHVGRPTNWCGGNRQFDAQGWAGHLTGSQRLRAKVNNHLMDMQGERFFTHGSVCP